MIIILNNNQQQNLKTWSLMLYHHNLFDCRFYVPKWISVKDLREIFGDIQLKKFNGSLVNTTTS